MEKYVKLKICENWKEKNSVISKNPLSEKYINNTFVRVFYSELRTVKHVSYSLIFVKKNMKLV